MDDNTVDTEFYDLLGLKMAGDASPDQLARLTQILNEHAALLSLYNHFEKAGPPLPYPGEVLEQSYASHYVKKKLLAAPVQHNQTAAGSGKRRITGLYKYLAIAAAVLPVLTFSIYYLSILNTKPKNAADNFKNEVATERGSKSKVMLPDSTLVVLNSDSRLTYDNRFNRHTREVRLTGEAFFDVKHDSEKPFIVHTEKTDIKVLGTAFNVRNYPQEDLMETSLIRGKIELTFDDEKNNRVILNPSEKIVISKSGLSKTDKDLPMSWEEDIFKLTRIASKDSTIAELAWLDNKFSFVNKSLNQIAGELEREFKTTIIFGNEAAKNYKYTIHSDNYDLNEIMQIIKLSKDINYRFISKDTLMIE
ncbi:MAG TPA: FecR family protein [Niabella sp.]|nr:FecR family protein [Niabella sp.]